MIGRVMRECKNYFDGGSFKGDLRIANGTLYPSEAVHNGWVAVCGSTCHDGVYWCADGMLKDFDTDVQESFFGIVWMLYPPADFVKLCQRIEQYESNAPASSVISESFGMYSYTAAQGKNGGRLTWQEAFASELRPFRRMYTEVSL